MEKLINLIQQSTALFAAMGTAAAAFAGIPIFKHVKGKRDERTTALEKRTAELSDTVVSFMAVQDKLVKAQLAALHDRVYAEGERLIKQGFATIDELNNFQYLYEGYSNLGGNGTGEVIYNHVSNLQILDGKTAYVKEAEKMHKERENNG
ncbi:hypothetical protein C6P08_04150 [Weissella confusa]|uniref:hypothetical protein n=1 Tax=Weissella confusa TaxID=1583 RepID=UPI001091EFA7|nr:hypothetical protein [Weissella confusa]MBJ7693992.1 hypothetical protein [Weissella confusa]QBZ04417.1 hypothetical protein C6P08_04150 [Weissella confusa]